MKIIAKRPSQMNFSTQIPNFIYSQSEQYSKFFLDASLMEYVRIRISYAKIVDAGIQIKIDLIMFLDERGELRPLSKEDTAKSVSGFRSKMIVIRPESGIFSAAEYAALLSYAEKIAIHEEHGGNWMSDSGLKKLWLSASNAEACFQFDLEERVNPSTSEIVPGLTQVAWRNMQILGVAASEEVAKFVDINSLRRQGAPMPKASKPAPAQAPVAEEFQY